MDFSTDSNSYDYSSQADFSSQPLDTSALAAPSNNAWLSVANNTVSDQPAQPTLVDSTPNAAPVTLSSTMDNLTGAFKSVAGAATDVLAMKTGVDQLKLQNSNLNLQNSLAGTNLQTQGILSNASMQIAMDNAKLAETMANTKLAIAQAQSNATIAAVQANPLSSQFVTGHGILGNLSADGKMGLLIGLASIYLMLKMHKGA